MTRCRLKLPDTTTEIQRWQKPPPVAQVRPTHCRHCHSASKPQGQPLGQGGLREQVARLLRQWGAPEPGEDGRDFAHRLFRQLPCMR